MGRNVGKTRFESKAGNLTNPRIDALVCPRDKSQAFIWDKNVTGLGVRVTSSGAKAFIFQARVKDGRTLRKTIGRAGEGGWKIDAARIRAREMLVEIDSDKDPRAESARKTADLKRKAANERRDKLDARTAWNAYIKERTPHWAALTLRNHTLQASEGGEVRKHRKKKTVPGPLAPLLALRLSEIDAPRVMAWLKREKVKRPAATQLGFVMLRAFMNWAAEQDEYCGAVHSDACRALKVRAVVPKTQARDDCLQREQLAAWFAAVRTLSPTTAAYLQCLLLTGARRTEMAALTWDKADLQWNTITIGTKTGERLIPLPPYCASLMSALPHKNEYVFASAKGSASGHIVDCGRAHDAAQVRAGIAGLSLHGLRRSFSTLGEWCDPPSGVIAQIMGHAPSAVSERHYKRRSVDFLRQWHERIEAWFLNEAGIVLVPDGKKLRVVAGSAA